MIAFWTLLSITFYKVIFTQFSLILSTLGFETICQVDKGFTLFETLF